jgi:glutamate transport system substrate-binding protein
MTVLMKPRNRTARAGRAPVVGAAVAVLLALTACSGDNAVPGSGTKSGSSSSSSSGSSGTATGGTDQAAYDAAIKGGPIASASDVSGNAWAARIKKAGVLKRGGTDTGALFSLKDPATGKVTGFDAGIGDLLARYIIGDGAKVDLTQTTVDTRETLLQNNSVDVTIATYSITPERAKKIAFAGPYYSSGDSILVKKSNTDIKSVKDLAGKTVATEGNSTAVTALEKFAPKAKQQLFQQDADCVAAVTQGRADAYVLDEAILLSDAVTNPDLKVVGKPFTTDPYGIGVTRSDPSAKKFVNAFLTKIEADGSWAKLWKATVGTVVEGDAPTPPKLGSVAGS